MTHSQHKLPIRIYYEDTDAVGVVYHANYLKFMERARCEYLAMIGFSVGQLIDSYQLQFVVSKLAISYSLPTRLGDDLMVHSRPFNCKRASVMFEQTVYLKEAIVAEAIVSIVCVNLALRPMAIPKVMRQELMRGN
jgi:acyl-CoA thioester hydrolase